MTDPRLYQLVKANRALFWSVGDDNLDKLDESSIVEGFLNFGNENNVKALFDILGTNNVAKIFYDHVSRPRHNYYAQPAHYFKLYFSRHAPQTNPHSTAN
jgi:hypothetical protein